MEQRLTFQCDLCPGSFPSSHALAAHRCWHRPSPSASSSKQQAITNTANKRDYFDAKFFDAASIVQEDVESEDESVEILDPYNGLSEEVDAANILVDLAQKRKMDGSSDYETRGKGKAIAATETKGGKLESADRSNDARALHNDFYAVLALECPSYICQECNITFPTYQALGGHRSGHSKKVTSASRTPDLPVMSSNGPKRTEGISYANIYACLYCGLEFPTGHAFGGHKRSRVCRSNYRDAASFEAPPPLQIQSPPSPPLSPVPPPSPDQPIGFLFDLNKPPPSDNEYYSSPLSQRMRAQKR